MHKIDYSKNCLPQRLLELPYFRRFSSNNCGVRICPKCIVIIDFSKKFLAALQANIVDNPPTPPRAPVVDEVAPLPILPKEVTPPRPPLIVKLSLAGKEMASGDIASNSKPPTDPPPILLHTDAIRLPKGLSIKDLTCYVHVERLRVPPITIRKLQSIIRRVASPEKTKKRVSFSNRHSIAEIPARKGVDSSSSSSSSEEEDNQGRPRRNTSLVNYKTRIPFSDSSDESAEESEGQIRMPDLRSRAPGKRALYTDPPSSSSDEEANKAPLKKFKVYRPAEAKRNSLKLASPTNTNGRSPTATTDLIENSPAKRKLFEEESTSNKSSSQESDVQRTKRPSRKSSLTPVVASPSPAQEQPNSQSPRRRLSVDSVITVSTTDRDESPMKVVNRRKTMTDSQPAYGRVRVISIDKLRAPDPQVDLLLAHIRAQTYLPNPFLTTP